MLRPFAGDRPKRAHHGSHTPCGELKEHTVCSDLCCRNFLVTLAQEDIDDGLLTLPPFVDVLLKHERGHCHYFDEATTRCSIHDKRPLPCRTFDCRDDYRSDSMRHLVNPDQPFVDTSERACAVCGATLRLAMGPSQACDKHAVCTGCGAGYRVYFHYGNRAFTVTHDPEVSAQMRRVYLLRALAFHHQFTKALPLARELHAELPDDESVAIELAAMLTELGQYAEARGIFEKLQSAEAALELAWMERRAGDLERARARLELVFFRLSAPSRVRALVELGRIALKQSNVEVAARWFVSALRGSRLQLRNDPMLKEFVLDLLRGSPEGKASVERVLLQGPEGAPIVPRGLE